MEDELYPMQHDDLTHKSRDRVGKTQRRYKIAAQGHLFSRPLIYGLEESAEVELDTGPHPSMADLLLCCEIDAALLPVVDLQGNAGGFTVVPAGCVACQGRSLTARIFSRVRPESMTALWVDDEAHTSSVLAQVLWTHVHNTRLDMLGLDPLLREQPEEAEAVLIVGDKVVVDPPLGFDWQIDLGAMWQETTGLPFVFAVWAAADPDDAPALHRILTAARLAGTRNLRRIAHDFSASKDWPMDLAEQCLASHTQYEFGEGQREGMEEFFFLAAECGAIDEYQPVRYYRP